jgi:hypothetical protein
VVIGIFHFGFRQRRFAGGTPVNGFFAFVNAAVEIELAEFGNSCRLVGISHCQIGIPPFAENP